MDLTERLKGRVVEADGVRHVVVWTAFEWHWTVCHTRVWFDMCHLVEDVDANVTCLACLGER